MLDKIVPGDLLPGMQVITRKAETGLVRICSIRFEHGNSVMTDDYTDDLFYGDGDEEHDLDIMRVALPSGTVIWERPIVEIRVFSKELHEQDCGTDWTWTEGLDGKLVSFDRIGGGLGHLDGYGIVRAWTRELTAEERANWKGARR